MQVVAGLSLKNLRPRAWDPTSPYYLPDLRAVMVSWAELDRLPALRRRAMEHGLHASLGIPAEVRIYLDNGAFSFLKRHREVTRTEYEDFVARARPDWFPIPQDYIPTPSMSPDEQDACFRLTMEVNDQYHQDGYIPVIHISPHLLPRYLEAIAADDRYAQKAGIALGGIVPNLLRAPKAIPYQTVLQALATTRQTFRNKQLHVFGIGGTATLHLAALLEINSVDSSGWRNRAARGLVQLPGRGDRLVANLGSWRGRELARDDQELLATCPCPACRVYGLEGLRARGVEGFSNRATHNLWTLLSESQAIEFHLSSGSYQDWYASHLDNTIYRPLVDLAVRQRFRRVGSSAASR